MTHAAIKLVGTLAVTGATAAVLSACGDDVPGGAVAKVDDTAISKKEFAKCVATRQSQPAPKGGEKPSAGQLKKQCKQEYDQLKGEVMQFLIQAQWVTQEADSRGVEVSDAEIKRSLADQKKQAFPNEKAYQKFLKNSGMTEQDILFRVKLDQLQQKLTQKVTEDEGKVSDADVRDYYDKNKKRFAQPERRDLNVVLTRTKAKAEQAKKALDSGDSFK